MKRKYRGIFAIGIALATITGTGLYSLNYSSSQKIYRKKFKAALTDDINLPQKKTLKKLQALTSQMPGLVFPSGSDNEPVNLSLFGYRPQLRPLDEMDAGGDTGSKRVSTVPRIEYSLSFAFSSGTKKYCIVDGKFYSEGSSLPNGGIIQIIKSNCILVNRHGIGKWIFVSSPVAESETSKKTKS